jgi:uncharacterized damage-inducible protein DinB
MITTQTASMLMSYTAWANRLVFNAVAELPPGEAIRERQTLFRNIVHTLNHNYIIDLIWQAHLEGREHGFAARNTKEYPPLDELWQKQQVIDAWYVALSATLSDRELAETIDFTLIGGNRGSMTRGEVLLHIYNHTTYHRGFIADIFYQVPAQPPFTDLPIFLREVPQNYA